MSSYHNKLLSHIKINIYKIKITKKKFKKYLLYVRIILYIILSIITIVKILIAVYFFDIKSLK